MNYETDVKVQEYRDVDEYDGATIQHVEKSVRKSVDNATTAQNIVYTLYGLIASILSMRLMLSLLGANPEAGFSRFIYSTTNMMVRPFEALFGIDTSIKTTGGRFEIETIMAIVVYGLLTWLIVRILSVKQPQSAN
jgi:NADH:ubiquinone oxidoreductase subunit 6 (subunit J)